MTYDALILADGLFPEKEEVRKLIAESPVVICCDGAAQKLNDFGRKPDYVVGDLDSLSTDLRLDLQDRLIHISEQNTNDLTKAMQFAVSKGWKKILITGATGLREDHTLGNISLLNQYLEWTDSIEMISDFGIFKPINNSHTFSSFAGQKVSLFSLTPACPISTEGLKYAVENYTLDSWWMGTLNESLCDSFSVKLHAKGKLIVYQAF